MAGAEPHEAAAARCSRSAPRLAIVKLGGEGVLVATEAGSEVVAADPGARS